jgi:hypothetical protein
MTSLYDDSKPETDRFKILVQGFAMLETKAADALCSVLRDIALEELNLEFFKVRVATQCKVQ